jgi:hypothetical protein
MAFIDGKAVYLAAPDGRLSYGLPAVIYSIEELPELLYP